MKIGIDAMGSDNSPQSEVLGAIESLECIDKDSRIVLFGDKPKIESLILEAGSHPSSFDIVHTSEVIEMHDHPAKSFSQKKDSSITVGFSALAKGQIDGFASAGNTGAMMVGVMYAIGVIEGVIRPCISSKYPIVDGRTALLVDVGLNADCKPENLHQYGLLSSIYAKEILGIENPRVALLNIGSEEEKGNLLTKAAYELMKTATNYNFVGNIEGYHLFTGKIADAVVCDGFVGNVVLKMAEGFNRLASKQNINNQFFDRLNYEYYGGTPVLGVNKPVIVGHGSSTPTAIKNMILQTEHVIKVGLVQKIKDALK